MPNCGRGICGTRPRRMGRRRFRSAALLRRSRVRYPCSKIPFPETSIVVRIIISSSSGSPNLATTPRQLGSSSRSKWGQHQQQSGIEEAVVAQPQAAIAEEETQQHPSQHHRPQHPRHPPPKAASAASEIPPFGRRTGRRPSPGRIGCPRPASFRAGRTARRLRSGRRRGPPRRPQTAIRSRSS